MEEIRWLTFGRRGERSPSLGLLQLDSTVAFGAMREQQASTRFMEQGYRILVYTGMIVAAVDLAQNLSVLEQQTLRAQSFVDHCNSAIARCRHRI